ncbi:MAG: RNA recognition motif domain-containing protein [Candidatus Dependentiae bacterium]
MNIYVGRISRSVNENKLKELFEQYGQVTSVKMIKDKFTGEFKGFAFVDMPEMDDAQAAISALNGMNFEGQELVVSEARPRENRPQGGFRQGGNGGRRDFGSAPRTPRFNRY